MDGKEIDVEKLERIRASIKQSGRGMQDLFVSLKMKEDLRLDMLERLQDVEKLTDIIHSYRLAGSRSIVIARAIIKFVNGGK